LDRFLANGSVAKIYAKYGVSLQPPQ